MLLPVSLVPFTLYPLSGVMAVPVVLLSAVQAVAAGLFFHRRDDISARRLLRASLVYLPALLVMMLLAR